MPELHEEPKKWLCTETYFYDIRDFFPGADVDVSNGKMYQFLRVIEAAIHAAMGNKNIHMQWINVRHEDLNPDGTLGLVRVICHDSEADESVEASPGNRALPPVIRVSGPPVTTPEAMTSPAPGDGHSPAH